MTSIVGGNASTLKGRDEIEKACAKFLSLFDTVYHSNGQQVVTIDGDRAKGVSYCTVMLIGKNAERACARRICRESVMRTNTKRLTASGISQNALPILNGPMCARREINKENQNE